jgi:TPR repeat protein
MSSPSATADAARLMPGGRGAQRNQIAALMPANDADSGQPIADLPPLIEPTFEPVGRRPPRRHFLAAVPHQNAARVSEVAPPQQAVSLEIPELIEPAPATEPREPVPAIAPLEEVTPAEPAPPQWSATARSAAPNWRRRLAAGAGIAIAFALFVTAAGVLRLGPFSGVRQYPISAAPTDPAQRLAYYQSGAQAGDANAELQLAIIYAKGDGVAQDYPTAATWFRAAADQGVARAQYDLGVLYERGRGVQVDVTEAANWYLKAAQLGYPLAQYNLAVCYTRGQGIREDLTEAALWYRRAATQGVVQAMINLGMMYEKGEGVALSPVDAYAWYMAAGRRNSQAAASRASDVYSTLPRLDQIRADALASDVNASIRDAGAEGEAVTNTEPSGH